MDSATEIGMHQFENIPGVIQIEELNYQVFIDTHRQFTEFDLKQ